MMLFNSVPIFCKIDEIIFLLIVLAYKIETGQNPHSGFNWVFVFKFNNSHTHKSMHKINKSTNGTKISLIHKSQCDDHGLYKLILVVWNQVKQNRKGKEKNKCKYNENGNVKEISMSQYHVFINSVNDNWIKE